MKITTLRVPDDLHKQIRHQALDENVSMNTCILQAIETKTEITSKGYICPVCYEKKGEKE